MYKVKDETKGLDIELELTPRQHATLASYVKTEGFDILQLLMEDQVRKFNLKLINTPVEKREDVIANHALAKGVTQWYAGLMKKLGQTLAIEAYASRTDGTISEPEVPASYMPEIA